MTLLSSFCNKTNGVLSRMRSSASRSSERQGSSPEASSSAQRSPCNDTDASIMSREDFSCRRQYKKDTNVSSERKGASPLNEWLSPGPVTHSESAFSNKRENWASCDPSDSVQELASDASSRCTEGSAKVAPRSRATSVDNGRYPPAQVAIFRNRSSSEPSARYADVESMLDGFDTAQSERSKRYNAVEGMLHFLDAQSVLHASSSAR
eukprot:CAMPEP_0180190556 /NCGR_PEP_ID=MMETSP0987-20121128/943_1 /TAXON_ID=697907 /ORGANISM="non described non described, Strain CCMP2293" /LENGTH=207 /DNA_ID=CAMNT_0022144991 /DNA_START=113 /DNA_END=736 /DNA_ORIENTATION=+